jgi:hypothetical protein
LPAVPARRATVAASLLVAASAAVPATADERPAPTIDRSRLLWATVNVCDTPTHPDTVGIRGSMPGSGLRQERMFMRFQVQYMRSSDGRWHNIGRSGDSGFVPVGSARLRVRQAGRNFVLRPPPAGGAWLVRGAVTFEWRRDGEVVRRARKRTTAGHPRHTGADPPGFSSATCEIR